MNVTRDQWEEKGESLFGADRTKWMFECPACGHVASLETVREDFGESPRRQGLRIGVQCVGRYTYRAGCDHTADGYLRGPLFVEEMPIFDFAGRPFTGPAPVVTSPPVSDVARGVARWTPEGAPNAGLHFKAESAAPPSRTKKRARRRVVREPEAAGRR